MSYNSNHPKILKFGQVQHLFYQLSSTELPFIEVNYDTTLISVLSSVYQMFSMLEKRKIVLTKRSRNRGFLWKKKKEKWIDMKTARNINPYATVIGILMAMFFNVCYFLGLDAIVWVQIKIMFMHEDFSFLCKKSVSHWVTHYIKNVLEK